MKIGFDAKRAFHNNRGLGNYSRDLIRILQERTAYELLLFNPKAKKHAGVLQTPRTKIITPVSFFWKKLKSLWRLFQIPSLASEEKIDLYHGLSGEIPFGIHKKVPTIVTIHDVIFMRYPHLYSFFDRKIHQWKFRYSARNAHKIIAISEQTKRDIVHFLGADEKKIRVVYQGCHSAVKKNYSEAEKRTIAEKYNLPKNFILCVGAIEERKNALEIVKTLPELSLDLVLIGRKTAYFQQIEDFCEKKGLKNRVIVLENCTMEEIAVIYQLAFVFCYPSLFEGFGIPIIEALFSRVPVITSAGSCFPEAGGAHSLYIDLEKNPSKQIKKYIQQLQSDAHLRETMTEKGYEYAQRFTDEAVFENLTNVYVEMQKRDLNGKEF